MANNTGLAVQKLSKLERETLAWAMTANEGCDCDGYNIETRRVRTRTLNSLEAKGLLYSVGMDGRRPFKDAGYVAARHELTRLALTNDEVTSHGY